MNYIKILVHKFGEKRAGLILFGIGSILGIFIARICKRFYWNELDILNVNYFNLITQMNIDYRKLRNYVLWKDFRNYLLLWGLSLTKFGLSFIVLFCLFLGFQAGFFVTVMLMGFGVKGLLLIIGYTFPQIIVYAPVIIVSLQAGYWLCRDLYYENLMHRRGRGESITKYGMVFVLVGILLFTGALIETYVGSFILKKILTLF